MTKKSKKAIKVGDKVGFHSGNFHGLTGVITDVCFDSTDPNAPFGIYHTVKLSDGRIGHIEKSEHWHFEGFVCEYCKESKK